MFFDKGQENKVGLCCNTTQPIHDTARGAPATRPAGGATTQPRAGAWANLCALVGPSWVLYAPDSVLTQLLDSILFMSHFLGTIHEHFSSHFFEKKN